MRPILPDLLWIGHAGDERNLRGLLGAGVAALVDLAIEEPPPALTRELIYCRFPLLDGSGNSLDLLRLAVQTVVHLVEMHTPTLICCGGGMSRSPAVASAALALVTGKDCASCLEEIRQTGPGDVTPGLWEDIQAVWESCR